jgi:hypothetical protein
MLKVLSPRTTQLECEADKLLPPTIEVKNAKSSTQKTTSLIQMSVGIKYFLPAVILKKRDTQFPQPYLLKIMEGKKIMCFPILQLQWEAP